MSALYCHFQSSKSSELSETFQSLIFHTMLGLEIIDLYTSTNVNLRFTERRLAMGEFSENFSQIFTSDIRKLFLREHWIAVKHDGPTWRFVDHALRLHCKLS